MPDGANTPRQRADASGEITLSARYSPWGDTLETYGDGGFTFGYFGGMMDAATGLLYVGNGQYYDPYTGRFLTRDAKLGQSNPYIPYDPIGALVAPLGLLSLYYSRKKNPGKWGMWLVLLIVVGSVGMGLSACFNNPTGEAVTASATATISTATPTPTMTLNLNLPATVTFTPSSPPTETGIPTLIEIVKKCNQLVPTPRNIGEQLGKYGVILQGEWGDEGAMFVLQAVEKVASRLADELKMAPEQAFIAVYECGYTFHWRPGDGGSMAETFYFDTIEVYFIWGTEYSTDRNTNNLIHELGHAFDYKVCKAQKGKSCKDGLQDEYVRTQLKSAYNDSPNLKKSEYGNAVGGWSGFAGKQYDWQFALPSQLGGAGEIWADMFLGWVYQNLGSDRQTYMNKVIPEYLGIITGR